MLDQKRDEIAKVKADCDLQIKKERDISKGLEKQFKRSLQEKDILENEIKRFYESLDGVEVKMQAKITENQKLQENNSKLQKQVSQMTVMILFRLKN